MRRDLSENGRLILAHGEVTGHVHEVVAADPAVAVPPAQFFEGEDGQRELIVLEPCVLTHQEHGRIALDPNRPEQVRQGDVLLNPTGPGHWRVIRQVEDLPDGLRQVAD